MIRIRLDIGGSSNLARKTVLRMLSGANQYFYSLAPAVTAGEDAGRER